MQYIFILGATSDIAQAVAKVYARHGYGLYLAARDLVALEALAADITIRYQVDVQCLSIDVLDHDVHDAIYDNLPVKPFGFVCAVGLLGQQTVAEKNFAHSQQVLATNFLSLVSFCNLVANDFEQRKQGFMAVISSVAGDRGRKSNYIYGAAKAGLTAYLSGLRNRLHASGVQVITIKPGFVDTKMTQNLDLPKRLTAQPHEVADAIYMGQKKGKDVIYCGALWRYIMLIIGNIPEIIFKRLSL